MTGVVTGGWAFVWAAYGITAAAFLLYGMSLYTRLKEESRKIQ